jgi:predicted MFS family arabinose efflux permease
MTCTEPDADTALPEPAQQLITRPLAAVFLSEFCGLTSFYLLLSVTPRYAAAAGAGSTGAGLVTGVLLAGTVLAELASAVLMRRFGSRTLLVAGALLSGIPALALHPGSPLGVIVAVSVVRGLGFGVSTVVAGALTAVLLPPERRGEGLGLFGVVASVPAVIALPSGVWLAEHVGGSVVVVMTAVVALIPAAAMPWLRGADDARKLAASTEQPTRLLDGIRHSGQLRVALTFAATTVAAGVVVSFLPLADGISGNLAAAGLLTQSLTATVGRWWAGRYGDRHGHQRLLAPALLISALAMAALIWPTSPIAVLAGMALFGAGFGIVQNATFALMIERMPTFEAGTASALWNLAFDGGYGAGPAAFGLIVGHTGYPAAFVMTGALMAAVIPATRGGAGRGASRA